MSERLFPTTKMPTDHDGNVFALGGTIGKTMRQAGRPDADVDDFYARLFATKSYGDALKVCDSIVDMTDWIAENAPEYAP